MVDLAINIIAIRELHKDAKTKVFIAKVVRDPPKKIRLGIPDNLTVVFINDIVAVKVVPYRVAPFEYLAQGPVGNTVYIVLITGIYPVELPSVEGTYRQSLL